MKKRIATRIEAARANGRLSQGPKTDEGKARSARNSVQHGLYSQFVVLSNEDQSQFDQLHASYVDYFQPATQFENDLLTDIVSARWRLLRILTLETAGLDYEVERRRPEAEASHQSLDEPTLTYLATRYMTDESRVLATYNRHEGRLQRAIDRKIDFLLDLQIQREKRQKKNRRNEPTGEQLPRNQQLT